MKYLLLFYFFISSHEIIAQNFSIKSIQAHNLEEDKGPFATFNDEICVLTSLYSLQKDSLYYLETSPILNFTDSISNYHLNFNFDLLNDSSTSLIIALIELDDNTNPDSLSVLFHETFIEYKFHPQNFMYDSFRTILTDNDLLGYIKLNFKQILKQEETITFKGMHLFNRYHYDISFLKQNP